MAASLMSSSVHATSKTITSVAPSLPAALHCSSCSYSFLAPLSLPGSWPTQCQELTWTRLPSRELRCPRGRQILTSGSRPILAMASGRSGSPTPSSRNSSKIVFVAGATGNTGKRIVKELLAQGFEVRAGVRDIEKAKASLPSDDKLEFVLADVTQSVDLLAKAIAGVSTVIVATGFRPSFDLTASWKVDNRGTKSMVDACRQKGIKRFVLVSSILANGAAIGQLLNPAYIVLNIFGLTLVAKLQAENYIRRSGLDYTIIRPGGLKNDPPSGNLVLANEDTLFAGSVSRDSVAQVAADSLSIPEASYKVVELISTPDAPARSIRELFAKLSDNVPVVG